MKRLLSLVGKLLRAARPFATRNTLLLVLAIASAFGVVAPDTATRVRNVVLAVPASTGDLT